MVAKVPWAILGVFLTSYLAVGYAVSTYWLDWKCNVRFNYTHFREDQKVAFPTLQETVSACFNRTFSSLERKANFTQTLGWDCAHKCTQMSYGLADEDGSLSPKLLDKIKEYYEKYSNGTSSYIKNLSNIYSRCAKSANDNMTLLKGNGTDILACEVNGLFRDCLMDIQEQFKIRMNTTTTEELCRNFK